jgi:hypothetical protein
MNLIGSVMVSVLASSVVDREFEPQRPEAYTIQLKRS